MNVLLLLEVQQLSHYFILFLSGVACTNLTALVRESMPRQQVTAPMNTPCTDMVCRDFGSATCSKVIVLV